MSVQIKVPTLGESITEATVGKWLMKEGDSFQIDEPLVEIETEKITHEGSAPSAGVLKKIEVHEGKDVAVALQALAKQFEQLQARFESFVRTIASSTTFQNLAKVAISTANAFITMAEALQPLVPLLTSLAAVKISSGLLQFGQGFAGGFKRGGGAGGLGKTVGGMAGGGGGGAASRSITNQNTI